MRQIDKHCPTTFQDMVGNKKTIDRIYRAVDDNDGFGGLVIMLLGQTGNGKTLLADIMAEYIDGELYSLTALRKRSRLTRNS
jgi:replication-associated recombination protein RarA